MGLTAQEKAIGSMSEMTRTPMMIAGEINAIKGQVRSAAFSGAVEIGKRLNEAKRLVPAGEWIAWLENNVSYSPRTAQNLMALAAEAQAGNTAALEGLDYTKAVLLLSVPKEEREEFVQEHPVEDMSTRELQKEIAQLRQKNQEMQLTMDQLIREQQESPVEDMRKETARLQGELEKQEKAAAQAARQGKDAMADAAQARREKEALEKDLRAQMETQQEAHRKDKEALEKALRDASQPVIQQVTPPDVEKELAELRAKLTRSQDEMALRAAYEMLRSSFGRLDEQLRKMEQTDAAMAGRFRQAFARSLRLMAEGLEKGEHHAA